MADVRAAGRAEYCQRCHTDAPLASLHSAPLAFLPALLCHFALPLAIGHRSRTYILPAYATIIYYACCIRHTMTNALEILHNGAPRSDPPSGLVSRENRDAMIVQLGKFGFAQERAVSI